MANKETSNFKQALNELLSGKISTDEQSAPPLFNQDKAVDVPTTLEEPIIIEEAFEYTGSQTEQETTQNTVMGENIDESQKVVTEIENAILSNKIEEIEKEIKPEEIKRVETPNVSVISMQQAITDFGETTIAHDVVIEGSVRSSSKLRIVGEVTGDVKSTADVVIEGKVGGSIQGNNIYLSECEVNNNVNALNEITISEGSMINGAVKAGTVTSNGVVNGNIDAQTVTLNGASRTVGDVKCKLIKIGEGAGLKGKIETID